MISSKESKTHKPEQYSKLPHLQINRIKYKRKTEDKMIPANQPTIKKKTTKNDPFGEVLKSDRSKRSKEEGDTQIKSNMINLRYTYNAFTNKFTWDDQSLLGELDDNQRQAVDKWIPYLISRSNVRRTSGWLLCFSFLLIAAVGFTLSILSIMLDWGLMFEGLLFITTPFAPFFCVFGYMMMRGGQIERFELWWKRENPQAKKGLETVAYNGNSLNSQLKRSGLQVMYSFSKGKNIQIFDVLRK